MHSAIHHEGRRLYDLARQGIEVARESRTVTFQSIELLELSGDQLRIAVNCSKGTYIRSLASDIGASLGCGAYLTGLRRTRSGSFTLEGAVTLDALKELRDAAVECLLPAESLVSGLAQCVLSAGEATRAGHGMTVPAPAGTPDGDIALRNPEGQFLGVSRHAGDGWLKPLRLMAEPPPPP